jgi:hypothetical protein
MVKLVPSYHGILDDPELSSENIQHRQFEFGSCNVATPPLLLCLFLVTDAKYYRFKRI